MNFLTTATNEVEDIIWDYLTDFQPVINDVEIKESKFYAGRGRWLADCPEEVEDRVEIEKAVVGVTVFDISQKDNIEELIDEDEIYRIAQSDICSSVYFEDYTLDIEEDYTLMKEIHEAIMKMVIHERKFEETMTA